MKNSLFKATSYLILVLLGCQTNHSTSAKSDEPIQNQDINISKVEQKVENLNMAIVIREEKALEEICAEELSYGHSSGLVQDKRNFINDVVNSSFNFISIDKEDQTIQLTGNIAFVRHMFLGKAINNKDSVDVRIGNTQVYRFDEDGQWRLLFRQAYKL
jgi:hypothetical protein